MAKIMSGSEWLHLHPKLAEVIQMAAARYNGPDVYVVDVLRTELEQAKLVKVGASRTMKSKHLKQADGYSHAVDVAFMVNGKVRFDWPLYYDFAEKVREACRERNVDITWGAIWDTYLGRVTGPLQQAQAAYIARFASKKGRKPLADGPHFQLG